MTPVTTVPVEGVRKRGCTRPKNGGSSPSRAMAKKMRACAMVITSMTEVMPHDRAELDGNPEPVQPRVLVEGESHGSGHVELLVIHHAGEYR